MNKLQELQTAQVINSNELPTDLLGREFQGVHYDNATVSFLMIDAPPGAGQTLHAHPYEEIFIIQQGQASFTVGDTILAASAGQIVIVPPGTPHAFVNAGNEPLHQIDIHASPRIITTWLDDSLIDY